MLHKYRGVYTHKHSQTLCSLPLPRNYSKEEHNGNYDQDHSHCCPDQQIQQGTWGFIGSSSMPIDYCDCRGCAKLQVENVNVSILTYICMMVNMYHTSPPPQHHSIVATKMSAQQWHTQSMHASPNPTVPINTHCNYWKGLPSPVWKACLLSFPSPAPVTAETETVCTLLGSKLSMVTL